MTHPVTGEQVTIQILPQDFNSDGFSSLNKKERKVKMITTEKEEK